MTTTRLVIICGSLSLFAGCAKEPPPRTVGEFLDNRILLEATMVRCGENRSTSKYEAECVNAREAINRIAVQEEAARRAELEAQSDRKRKSLRRTQQAAAEARRRAADLRRRQETAEYLGVFDEPAPGEEFDGTTQSETEAGPESAPEIAPETNQTDEFEQSLTEDTPPAGEVGQDLEAIREELRRRQESD